jgi:hypothetical protein
MPFEAADPASEPREAATPPRVEEEIWLLGQPSLVDFLNFVDDNVEGAKSLDQRALVDDWRRANDHYAELEKREAGFADGVVRKPLPQEVRPLAAALEAQPFFRAAFDRLPVEIALVEVERLMVRQIHVAKPHVDRLAAKLRATQGPESLFEFCQPTERQDPPVSVRRLDSSRYVFSSPSTDFRSHDPVLIDPAHLSGHVEYGPVAAALGLIVGYGSNLLNVIESDGRMLLHNGYHRAVALCAAGIKYAPCVIQSVTRRDELELVATQAVIDDPAFYFRARRPPVVKDFFDPKIRKLLPVRRRERIIEISFEINELTVDVP